MRNSETMMAVHTHTHTHTTLDKNSVVSLTQNRIEQRRQEDT